MRRRAPRAAEAGGHIAVASGAVSPPEAGAASRVTPTPPGWPQPSDAGLEFLAGGGEMGERIRACDWSRTPLGPPDGWPRGLRNSLRLVLAASHPASIAWGREPLYFCNDAFARLLAADRWTDVLGPSARDVWPHPREPGLGPLLDGVRERGLPVVAEDQLICVARNGRAEEVYVTCRFEPIPGEAGAIDGVLLTLAETTERVVNARRTAALRGLASEAASARSVEEAYARTVAEMARHPADIPFALLYARDVADEDARLVGTAGLLTGTPASPTRVGLDHAADTSGWPLGMALARNDVLTVDDLPKRFGPLPGGDWPLAPRVALIAPLAPPGCERPEAVHIVGVCARRAHDTEYRGYIELVVRQVTAAIAAGRTYEERRRHTEAAATSKRRARARRRERERALEARYAGVLEERTRMAREIHDTLLQGVTGIALQLRAALPRVQRTPTLAVTVIEEMVALAETTSHDARRAVWDMRAPASSEGGLPGALRDAARRVVGAGGARVDVRVRGTPRTLPPAIQDAIFHVGQQAVVNAVKHADAQRILVRMRYGRWAVRLTVVDDGRGFHVDPDFRSYVGHWGLIGMREQAERIGATFTVTSTVGAGTTVDVLVPMRRSDAVPCPRLGAGPT
jgi:signal transduction histidine kinase